MLQVGSLSNKKISGDAILLSTQSVTGNPQAPLRGRAASDRWQLTVRIHEVIRRAASWKPARRAQEPALTTSFEYRCYSRLKSRVSSSTERGGR